MSLEATAMVVRGTIIHAPQPGEVEIIEDALVFVDADGTISEAGAFSPAAIDAIGGAVKHVELRPDQYLLPGLVDLHIHAPQWPQLGKALHLPLNEWLQRYTFPLEARYHDAEFARLSYASLVENLLANGTTTATYFGTVHLEATKLLADIALQKGQRALVGKVAMDNHDECPPFYRDPSTAAGLDGTRALIEYIRDMPGNESERILPAVTPRFIPSCSDEMLDGLARIAEDYGCHVQTHCSESDWEHGYVLQRHKMSDTDSLDRFGLLTDKTVLAHANLIDNRDMATIRMRHSAIAHCPLSNFYLSHAVFPTRKALDLEMKIGLGTDIAGGPSPSILQNCQAAVLASRALEDGVDPRLPPGERGSKGARIDFREAFWMATAGGAAALGLKTGRFVRGFAFDALVIDAGTPDSDLKIWPGADTADDILQKIIYNANRHNIVKVWVQGKLVQEHA